MGCTPPSEENEQAEELQSPVTITTETGVEMVLAPGGSFMMGDDEGPVDGRPAHRVTISLFYMDKYEVSQGDYTRMTGTNSSKFGTQDWQSRPVERVEWRQAILYCNERSRREGLRLCYDEETYQCDFEADGYRLATEAEWEYAYRAGTSERYFFGDEARGQLGQYGWFKDNSGRQTHPVGGKKPNRWGLYDMAGNVAEWCNDFYDAGYYKNSPERDPRGPEAGDKKVLRGGSWNSGAEACGAASRASDLSGFGDTCLGDASYGFRCVKNKK